MRLQLVRNATLRLSYAGKEILIDPCFGAKGSLPSFAGLSANPIVDMPADAGEVLDGIDLVLISHLHPDHFDSDAEALLPKHLQIFCQPEDLSTFTQKGFVETDALAGEAVWSGISIARTPGQHGRGEILLKTGSVMGFVLKAAGEPTVYVAGDTVLTSDVVQVVNSERPDVIVTNSGGANISGTLIIMDDAETIDLLKLSGEAKVVAVHMEALDHCPVTRAQLREAANAAGIPEGRLLIPADGQWLTL